MLYMVPAGNFDIANLTSKHSNGYSWLRQITLTALTMLQRGKNCLGKTFKNKGISSKKNPGLTLFKSHYHAG